MHSEIAFHLSIGNTQSAAVSEGSEQSQSFRSGKQREHMGQDRKCTSFIKKSWCILRSIHHNIHTLRATAIRKREIEKRSIFFCRGDLPRTYLWMCQKCIDFWVWWQLGYSERDSQHMKNRLTRVLRWSLYTVIILCHAAVSDMI